MIPDSLSCILDSKAEDSEFYSKNLEDSRIRILLHEAIYVEDMTIILRNIISIMCNVL